MEIRADQLDSMDVAANSIPVFVNGEVKTYPNTQWDALNGQDVIVTGFNSAMLCVQHALMEIKEYKTFHNHPINWKTFVIIS